MTKKARSRKEQPAKSVTSQFQTTVESDRPRAWECFFRDQPFPVFRSQLLTALMAGTPLDVEHIPVRALADVAIIAAVSRYFCNAEVVTDWKALISKVRELWDAPTFSHKVFSNMHLRALASVIYHNSEQSAFSDHDELYLPELVRWYLEQETPDYFERTVESLPSKKTVQTKRGKRAA